MFQKCTAWGLDIDLAQNINACDVCILDKEKDAESDMNRIIYSLLILELEKNESLIQCLWLLHESNMVKMRLLTFMGMAVDF
ncbi:eukaryotic translation initiation factor 3 subunit m [Arapaima gigas]